MKSITIWESIMRQAYVDTILRERVTAFLTMGSVAFL